MKQVIIHGYMVVYSLIQSMPTHRLPESGQW